MNTHMHNTQASLEGAGQRDGRESSKPVGVCSGCVQPHTPPSP